MAIWGVTFVSTKTLIGAGMHPAAIFVIRFVMAYAGIWVLTLTEKKPVKLWSDSRKDEWIFVFLYERLLPGLRRAAAHGAVDIGL